MSSEPQERIELPTSILQVLHSTTELLGRMFLILYKTQEMYRLRNKAPLLGIEPSPAVLETAVHTVTLERLVPLGITQIGTTSVTGFTSIPVKATLFLKQLGVRWSSRGRTCDILINSEALCQLSYRPRQVPQERKGEENS